MSIPSARNFVEFLMEVMMFIMKSVISRSRFLGKNFIQRDCHKLFPNYSSEKIYVYDISAVIEYRKKI